MSRKTARKNAFALCYQIGFHGAGELEKILSYFYSKNRVNADDESYISTVVTGVYQHIGEIDGLIKKYSNKWDPDRIGRADMAIMRVCLYEMLKLDDIPVSVSINEAVELAKLYGSDDDTPSFINGILGGISKDAIQ